MDDRRILVTYASKHGSTGEIATAIGAELQGAGLRVDVRPVAEVRDLGPYRAVVVGSALYMMRWRRPARAFLKRHTRDLLERDVWLFSSGPLDHSADEGTLSPPRSVTALATRVGAHAHRTFGGKLPEDASGRIAEAMARNGHAGDFRDFDSIRSWADAIATELTAGAGSA